MTAQDVDDLALAPERTAHDVFEELRCDWPLLSPDDIGTLCSALEQSPAPAWFRIDPRFLKGVDYLCDAGFTRAGARALPGTAGASSAAQAPAPGSTAGLVTSGVLAQVDRLLAGSHAHAAAELAGLTLPSPHRATEEEEPLFSLSLGQEPAANGRPQGDDEPDSPDLLAAEEDGDDFVFESIETSDASARGWLSSLLPTRSDPTHLGREGGGTGAEGWEESEETLRKLAVALKSVSYPRIASLWQQGGAGGNQVQTLVLRILQRLLALPASVWGAVPTPVSPAPEQHGGACDSPRHGGGESAAALLVHVCFLVRDHCGSAPGDAGECVRAVLGLLPAAAVGDGSAGAGGAALLSCLLIHICAAAVGLKHEAASSEAVAGGTDVGGDSATGLGVLQSVVSEQGAARARKVCRTSFYLFVRIWRMTGREGVYMTSQPGAIKMPGTAARVTTLFAYTFLYWHTPVSEALEG